MVQGFTPSQTHLLSFSLAGVLAGGPPLPGAREALGPLQRRLSCPQAIRNLGVPTRRRDSPRWALESARLPWQVQRGGVAPNVSFLPTCGKWPRTSDTRPPARMCKLQSKTLTLSLPNHQVLEAMPKLPQRHCTVGIGSPSLFGFTMLLQCCCGKSR